MRVQLPHFRLKAVLPLLLLSAVPCTAMAGSVTKPSSRVYTCFMENPESPQSPACEEAVEKGGVAPIRAWFGVSRGISDEFGKEDIPDGKLCSANIELYKGLDLVRDDWRATLLTPDTDNTYTFVYGEGESGSAGGESILFVSKDNYKPDKPLRWESLESEPFCRQQSGSGKITCKLPETKSGRHLIYFIHKSGDKASYSCLDVVFQEHDYNNEPPVAIINGPYDSIVGQTIDFVSSGSHDRDGRVVSYYWDFGDGAVSEEVNPRHSFDYPGTFSVSLTVTDDDDATDQKFIMVKIDATPDVSREGRRAR